MSKQSIIFIEHIIDNIEDIEKFNKVESKLYVVNSWKWYKLFSKVAKIIEDMIKVNPDAKPEIKRSNPPLFGFTLNNNTIAIAIVKRAVVISIF